MRIVLAFMLAVLVLSGAAYGKDAVDNSRLLVLCYHDVPKTVKLDKYGVDRQSFVQQIEYLRAHGYQFVSLEDVLLANRNKKALPPKAVLLTFDDAYLSFYEFVYPLLSLYKYPCVLAVVTSWVDDPPKDLKLPLMNWEQIAEVARSGLVEVASHSHALHKGVVYNPQGNSGWAAVSRMYDPAAGAYESGEEFEQRICADLSRSLELLKSKAEVKPRVMVWPYGQYNQAGIDGCKSLGIRAVFELEDELGSAHDLFACSRVMVVDNPDIGTFINGLKRNFNYPLKRRIAQIDLDLVYDEDPVRQEKNLDALVERIFKLKVNTVYVQAFCDDKGDGNVASVYFPNRVLPMKADLFSRVVNQLAIREMEVYAWMPMLSIVLPDKAENDALRVREESAEGGRLSTSWYERLSPFSLEAREKICMLYEDMAASARIEGVVFQDDGYLNDFEDAHPRALEEYRRLITGGRDIPFDELTDERRDAWTRVKTARLIDFTEGLKAAVLRYRPHARFARTIYAPVVLEPYSEEWFAQNYRDCLAAYDYVCVMAYPLMEEVNRPGPWLKKLVRAAEQYPGGIEKTIFKVQAYDWKRKTWVKGRILDGWMRILVAAGARHIGYYPDSFIEELPDEKAVREMISVEDFPYKRTLRGTEEELYK